MTFGKNVKYIGAGSFESTSVESIAIPESVKVIDDNAFGNCSALKTLELSDGIRRVSPTAFPSDILECVECVDGVRYIGDLAHSYDKSRKFTEIKIKDGTINIVRDAKLGENLLYNVEKEKKYSEDELKEVIGNTVIPDSVAAIGENAFAQIPEADRGVSYVGDWAVKGSSDATAVNLKEGTKGIADTAFSGCGKLTGITVPESVKYIGYKAFNNCRSLDAIVINNPECEIFDSRDTISTGKDNHDNDYFTGTIYGYSNSAAQAYAEKYDCDFKALDEGAVPPEIIAPEPLPELPKGDANADGKLDIRDAALIAKYLAKGGGDSLSDFSDFNNDERLNIRDCAAIARYLANDFNESGLSLEEYISKHQPEPSSYELNGESLSISSAKTHPGYTVTVYFNVACNNNFGSMDIIASFNKKLEASDAQPTGGVSCASDHGTGYVTVVAYGSCEIADGSVAAVDFTVPANAKVGDVYNIDVALVKTFSTFNGEDIASIIPVSGGTITVVDPNAPYEPEVTTAAQTTTVATTTTTITTATVETTAPQTTEPTETAPVGDANGDNKLNVRDAAFIAKMLAQGKVTELPLSADFNGDGKVNVRDAAAIAKFLATGKR